MRYSGGGEPSDDLVQVASVGLMGAIDRYDPERGVPFAGFAGPTILGELRRHFRDRVWTLRVPRGLQERIRGVEDAITKLGSELERSPTVAEVAESMDAGEDEVLEAMEAGDARRTVSLDQPAVGDDSGDSSIVDRVGQRGPRLRAGRGARRDLRRGAGALRPRARGPAAALRRGPHPVEDRRPGRLLADARLADPAPRA